MTLVEMHMNRSLMLMDRLGPEILLAFWMKGRVLHRKRVHLKVPDIGCRILVCLGLERMFLSRLKDESVEVKIFHLFQDYPLEFFQG